MDSFTLAILIFGGLAWILVMAFAWALCAAGSSREEDQLDAIAEMLERQREKECNTSNPASPSR